MKALISTNEQAESGYRVAQVEPDDKIFEVHSKLFWIDCPDNIKAGYVWYDPITNTFKDFPPVSNTAPVISNSP